MKRVLGVLLSVLVMGCAGIQTGDTAHDAFDRGMALFNQYKYAEAAEQFKTAIERDPDYSQAHLYLGKAYINQRQWLEAVKSLKTAYQLSPKETKKETFDILTDAVVEGADQLSDLGKLSTWLGFLGDTMTKHPELTASAQKAAVKMVAMARELIDKENYKPALQILQHLITTTSAKVSDYLDLALKLAKKGYPLKAPGGGN